MDLQLVVNLNKYNNLLNYNLNQVLFENKLRNIGAVNTYY